MRPEYLMKRDSLAHTVIHTRSGRYEVTAVRARFATWDRTARFSLRWLKSRDPKSDYFNGLKGMLVITSSLLLRRNLRKPNKRQVMSLLSA